MDLTDHLVMEVNAVSLLFLYFPSFFSLLHIKIPARGWGTHNISDFFITCENMTSVAVTLTNPVCVFIDSEGVE